MERYLLFCGDRFYPEGGMKDLRKDSNDRFLLELLWDDICEKADRLDSLWAHIYDTKEERIISYTEYDSGQKCQWAEPGEHLTEE